MEIGLLETEIAIHAYTYRMIYMATHPLPLPPTTLATLRLRMEKAGLSRKKGR